MIACEMIPVRMYLLIVCLFVHFPTFTRMVFLEFGIRRPETSHTGWARQKEVDLQLLQRYNAFNCYKIASELCDYVNQCLENSVARIISTFQACMVCVFEKRLLSNNVSLVIWMSIC